MMLFIVIFMSAQKEPTNEEMQDFVTKLTSLSKNIQGNARWGI